LGTNVRKKGVPTQELGGTDGKTWGRGGSPVDVKL